MNTLKGTLLALFAVVVLSGCESAKTSQEQTSIGWDFTANQPIELTQEDKERAYQEVFDMIVMHAIEKRAVKAPEVLIACNITDGEQFTVEYINGIEKSNNLLFRKCVNATRDYIIQGDGRFRETYGLTAGKIFLDEYKFQYIPKSKS